MTTRLSDSANVVSVHGREALRIPYSRWTTTGTVETQVDLSASTVFIEIPNVNLRRQLIANPSDPKGLLIYLPREDVARIPTRLCPFVIIDETDYPHVEWEGQIQRTGYTDEPNE